VGVKRTEIKRDTSQLSTGGLKDLLFVHKHTVNAMMRIVPRTFDGQR